MRSSTVLMVDDSPADVYMLTYAAKVGCRFQVHSAASVESAMQYLDTHSDPDLVVLDFSLGGDDGLEVLRRMRQETRLRSRVVLLSGYVKPEVERLAKSYGVPCFEKPAELDGWSELAAQFSDLSANFN